jgi:DNA-binding transcriptional ArsR family regulator
MRNISLEKLDFIANTLKVVSHPIRIKIIEVLENNAELSVQDISKLIGENIEQSLLSHHLIKMKNNNIIESKKIGQFVFYKLKLKELSNLLDCMEKCKLN